MREAACRVCMWYKYRWCEWHELWLIRSKVWEMLRIRICKAAVHMVA